MALGIAKSVAVKDACDHIGNIFGANLNRKDSLPIAPDSTLSNIVNQKEHDRMVALIDAAKSRGYEVLVMDTMLDPVIYSFSASLPAIIILPPEGQVGFIENLINSPVFQLYRSFRAVLALFPWISLVLAMMIVLLSLRSLHWMSGALGAPLVIASMVSSIPGAWLFLIGGRDLSSIFAENSLGTLQGLEGLLIQVFQKGLQTAGQGLLVWCLGALSLGLVLMVAWFMTKK